MTKIIILLILSLLIFLFVSIVVHHIRGGEWFKLTNLIFSVLFSTVLTFGAPIILNSIITDDEGPTETTTEPTESSTEITTPTTMTPTTAPSTAPVTDSTNPPQIGLSNRISDREGNFHDIEAYNITSDDACISAYIDLQYISEAGYYIGTSNNNMIQGGLEYPNGKRNRIYYETIRTDEGSKYGSLRSNTTYYYYFYYVKDNYTYVSKINTFKTKQ